MLRTEILNMLKIDLGLTTEAYDLRLGQCIESAKNNIIREGVSTLNENAIDDANLIVLYSAWMWRKRDSGEGMPRMLRWALNNRIMQEKAR